MVGARERYGIEPDMITFAKGVTSGYMPLGGVLVRRAGPGAVLGRAGAGAVFRHGYTYSGPRRRGCAAAMANLDIIEREGLVERVAALEPVLADALVELDARPARGRDAHRRPARRRPAERRGAGARTPGSPTGSSPGCRRRACWCARSSATACRSPRRS